MGFFDWISNAAGNLWSGIKNVSGNVYEGAKSAVNWVADKVKPIVETVGKVASYIPVIGAPISGIANQISSGIGAVQKGLDTVGSIGGAVGKAFSRK